MRKAIILTVATTTAVALAAGPHASAAPVVKADIVRDRWGIAHIYADDTYSLFFANGYAQAQDRLAQMEILRHVGQGRLAELTGRSGLALDLVTRRELYTEEERLRAAERLEPLWQEAFQAFTDGVNKWINEVRLDPTKLPAEYPALLEIPEDWKPTDTLAIAQYLLDVFGRGGGGQEVSNSKIFGTLEGSLGDADAAEDALRDLVWVQRDDTYTTIKENDGVPEWPTPDAERALEPDELTADQREAIAAAITAEPVDDAAATIADAAREAGLPFKLGSNAQLIDERFSASGRPLLFGGPQMAYFNPMIPYELSLHGAGFDASGMGVAGAPGVIIGRGAHHSWTVTSGSSDQVDMVVEKLTGPEHYILDGVEQAMECRTETHLVRPGPAEFAGFVGALPETQADTPIPTPDVVEQRICRTVHGPILYRTPDGKYAVASQRSYRGDEARSGTLWLQIGQAQTRQQFQDLLETFAFEFNFSYANDGGPTDPDGELMYMHVGKQPIRDTRLDPRFPRPGWDSGYNWKGFLTGSQLPHVVNPLSGYTVNWNNNPSRGWPSGDIREQWGDVHRAELMDAALTEVLTHGDVTLDDLRAVNEYASTHEPFAGDFYAAMRDAAVNLGLDDVRTALDDWAASGFDWADRDGDGFHDFAAFRLYELWRDQMQQKVFGDEIPGHIRALVWDPPKSDDPHAADHGNTDNKHTIVAHILTGDTAHDWCDDVTTEAAESCAAISTAALQDAIASEPAWAQPFPMRQSVFVPMGAGEAHSIPMTNRPSFQHFYDWGLAEGTRSFNAVPPGVSGHMTIPEFLQITLTGEDPRPHANDQLQTYVNFDDKPLLFVNSLADWRTTYHQYRKNGTALR